MPSRIRESVVANWVTVCTGLVGVAVGAGFRFTSDRRAQYERVLVLAAESGTAPITEDRHTVGMAFEAVGADAADQAVELSVEEMAALFRVLWFFQRAAALYDSLRLFVLHRRITRTRALLLESLGSMIRIWDGYLGRQIVVEGGGPVSTEESARSLHRLAEEYRRYERRRRHAAGSVR